MYPTAARSGRSRDHGECRGKNSQRTFLHRSPAPRSGSDPRPPPPRAPARPRPRRRRVAKAENSLLIAEAQETRRRRDIARKLAPILGVESKGQVTHFTFIGSAVFSA